MAIIREISPIATKRCQNSFVNDYFYGVTSAIISHYSVGNWDLNCQQNIYSLLWKPILIAGTLMYLVRCTIKSSTKTSYILQRGHLPKTFRNFSVQAWYGQLRISTLSLAIAIHGCWFHSKMPSQNILIFSDTRWALSPATVQKFSLLLWREEHVNCIEGLIGWYVTCWFTGVQQRSYWYKMTSYNDITFQPSRHGTRNNAIFGWTQ